MSPFATLPYPSSRTLAGWWRQLEPLEPREIRLGHLFVHRVEAAVFADQEKPLPAEQRFLLEWLSLSGGDATLEDLQRQLPCPVGVLMLTLREAAAEGLIESAAPRTWRLSSAGAQALKEGKSRRTGECRRVFSFVEHLDAAGARRGPPSFLPLTETPLARPWRPEASFPFEVAWLDACINQDAAWKEGCGFPADVHRVVAGNGAGPPSWRNVVVDRTEEVTAVIVVSSSRVRVFAVRLSDWSLDSAQPILVGDPGVLAAFEPAPLHNAREAWLSWARPRNLASAEACSTTLEGVDLHIQQAPARLVETLRHDKSDLLKGDAWVLLGEGWLRQAARLRLG